MKQSHQKASQTQVQLHRHRIRYNADHAAVPFRFFTTMGTHLRVYDWNADGKPDLIDSDLAFGPTKIFVAFNTGTRQQPRFSEDKITVVEFHPQDDGTGNMDSRWQLSGR